MALTMTDKPAARKDRTAWPAALQEEFAREAKSPNGCVGSELVSETDKVRVWTIRLEPGLRFGFHRHVLNYFWTAVTPCRGRQHLMDGTTVEYTMRPARPATRPTGRVNSRCTTWRTSATATWCS